MVDFVSTDNIRSQFSAAMSQMYREEVPAYSDLVEIVNDVNQQVLSAQGLSAWHMDANEDLQRLSEERHGAIRVGTAQELSPPTDTPMQRCFVSPTRRQHRTSTQLIRASQPARQSTAAS